MGGVEIARPFGRSSTRSQVALLTALAMLFAVGCDRGPKRRAAGTAEDRSALEGGRLVFEEDFEGSALDGRWSGPQEHWTIEDGMLSVSRAQNEALWLDVPLPDQVRVELDAVADDPEGDIKFEIFGDGATHESGYIVIFGGWDNTITCIARLGEHNDDRLDAPVHRPVVVGRTYHLAAVRTDNRLRLFIDGVPVLTYDDTAPLEGEDHRFFAFNNWHAPVRFDNLRIYDLGQ
jgi:hypothetical protein